VVWSILGTLLPGSGLMAAGKRAAGVVVLGVAVLTISVLAGFSMLTDPVAAALRVAVSPTMLLYAVAAVGLVALLWIILVIVTHVSLRQLAVLTGGQEALCAALVVGLIGAVLLPAVKLGSYALIQRDLVSSVFSASSPNHGARPNLSKADPWANIPRVNVLLIGSDAGADREGVRPDTLILASVNTHTGDTVMFSLPRNLERVPFPIGTPGAQAWPNGFQCAADACLLNAIWRWAEGAGPGPNGRSSTLAPPGPDRDRGRRPESRGSATAHALLNLAGFSQFVDAMRDHDRRPGSAVGGSGDPPPGFTSPPAGGSKSVNTSTATTRSGTPARGGPRTTTTGCAASAA
jgi:hypothetical protein